MKCGQISLELISWGPDSSLESERKIRRPLFTFSINREIRHFHFFFAFLVAVAVAVAKAPDFWGGGGVGGWGRLRVVPGGGVLVLYDCTVDLTKPKSEKHHYQR